MGGGYRGAIEFGKERAQVRYHGVSIAAHGEKTWIFVSVAMGKGGYYLIGVMTKDHAMDAKTRTELEAAVYRRLVDHLRQRTDVQNIDMMNLAGFCRNCLSNWMKDAADGMGVSMTKDESRAVVYGMPYDEWRQKYQKEASAGQKATFEKSRPQH
jgi:hypothetical protein